MQVVEFPENFTLGNGKTVDLPPKRLDIEIEWGKNSEGKSVDKQEINGKRIKRGIIVVFEKEGKEYQIAMKINRIKKGWFKDEIVDYTFEPLPNDKLILNKAKFWKTGPLGLFGEDCSPNTIKPTQRRKSGFILLTVISVAVLFIFVVIVKKINRWSKGYPN